MVYGRKYNVDVRTANEQNGRDIISIPCLTVPTILPSVTNLYKITNCSV